MQRILQRVQFLTPRDEPHGHVDLRREHESVQAYDLSDIDPHKVSFLWNLSKRTAQRVDAALLRVVHKTDGYHSY